MASDTSISQGANEFAVVAALAWLRVLQPDPK